MTRQHTDIKEQDLTWSQLHEFSGGLLLSSGCQTIEDGANLLSLIQQLYGECDRESVKHIPQEDLLSGLRIVEGLIRIGNGINTHYDALEGAKA